MEKIKNKKVLILGTIFMAFTISVMVGLTYAFFSANVEGNNLAEPTVITAGTLRLVLNDTNALNMNNAFPGASASKTFTVTNTGNAASQYDILIEGVSTTFTGRDLVYTVTSNNGGGTKTETVLPNTDETIIENITIEAGVTQTYTFTVTFKETGLDQNNLQGAAYSGKLQIIPRISSVAVAGYVTDANGNGLEGKTVELHSDPVTTTTNAEGYYEFRNIPVGTHTVYVKDNETTIGSKEVTLLLGTGTILVGNSSLKLEYLPTKYVNIKVDQNNGLNFEVSEALLMLSETSGTLYIGGSNKSLTISGRGYGALSCSSSDVSATCRVSNGTLIITPVALGTGTITLTENKTNKIVEYSYEVKGTSISLSETSGTVYIGKTKTITASGENIGRLYCGTTNSEVSTCKVENNTIKIKTVGLGTATITVREANGNKTATYEVTSESEDDLGIIALYVDNKQVSELDRTKAYKLANYECSNGETVKWDVFTFTPSIQNMTKTTSCKLYFVEVSTLYKYIINAETPQSDASVDFATSSQAGNTNGLYYTADASTYGEDNTRIYYYRGNVQNNWVTFGGYLWRIVRTTSEGGVKLVYSGNGSGGSSAFIGSSLFNIPHNTRYAVGYTYNTGGYTGSQGDSIIKCIVDGWYTGTNVTCNSASYDFSTLTTKLTNYSSYLSTTAVYCNDKSTELNSSGGAWTSGVVYYPAYIRLSTNKRPTYVCPSTNESRYTASTSTGNGYLTYPIALLTADEVSYAGVVYSPSTLQSYITNNAIGDRWWTMSPFNYSGTNYSARGWHVTSSGNLYYNYYEDYISSVRPSISIKSCVTIIGNGDGSSATPYELSNANC